MTELLKNKAEFKNTKLGLIPIDWEVKKLGDIGKIRMCKRIFSKETSLDAEIPFYKIGTFGKKSDAFISSKLYKHYKTKFSFPKKGDILISAAGTIGRTVVYDGTPSYFQDSNIVWIDNNEKLIQNKLLYYILQTVRYESEGGTIQRLYNSIINNTKFILPPLPEQQKIAEILSKWDELIAEQTQLIGTKETRKTGLMQKLLSGEVRFPGFTDEWKKVKLENLGATFSGLSGKTKEDFGIGKPFITYMNIYSNSKLNKDDFSLVDIKENENQHSVKYGDIFFTTSSETPTEVGMSSVLLDNVQEVYLNSFCFGFRLKNFKTLSPEFARFYLRGTKVRKELNKLAQGATRYNISKVKLIKTIITLPSLKEQQRIASVLSSCDIEIQSLKEELKAIKKQKKGLMQKLLTGEIRVKV